MMNGAANGSTARGGRRFLWSLRHYAWVVLACLLLGCGVALFIGPAADSYQANALVVARQISVNPAVLPDLAQNIFSDGAVAARVSKDPAVHGDISGLIPDRITVAVGQDTIAMDVQAVDPDPATAARLANLAAAAFVDELNRSGSGVGQFVLQSPAIVPATPVWALTQSMWTGIGALAGLLVGLGLVALLSVIRAPVTSADDVVDALGVPLLGTVRLPRARPGVYPGPLGVAGIATVSRALAGVPAERLLFVSSPADARLRQRLFVMTAVALWTVRKIRVAATEGVASAIGTLCRAARASGRSPGAAAEASGELVLVDGGSPLEIIDPTSTSVSAVAVAQVGVPRRALTALGSDYAGGGLVGVVLVRAPLSLHRWPRPPQVADPSVAPQAPRLEEVPAAEDRSEVSAAARDRS